MFILYLSLALGLSIHAKSNNKVECVFVFILIAEYAAVYVIISHCIMYYQLFCGNFRKF